jgi:hypothetical protein
MLRRHPLQEVDHGAAHGLAFDVLKRCTESESLGSRQESNQIHLRAMTLSVVGRVVIEEVGYGHSQCCCQPFHGARAYAIDTPLVLLDLLETHIQGRTQIGLAHAQHHATRAHSVADADVGKGRTTFASLLHEQPPKAMRRLGVVCKPLQPIRSLKGMGVITKRAHKLVRSHARDMSRIRPVSDTSRIFVFAVDHASISSTRAA